MRICLKILLILFFLCISSQRINAQEIEIVQKEVDDTKYLINDLPKEINCRYVIPIIPNKETALQMVDVIVKNRYVNVDFDKLKPYEIKLIANHKVWEVKITQEVFLRKYTYYYIRLNRNTGEVIDIWKEL